MAPPAPTAQEQFAIHLFNGAARGYDWVAEVLSYGQYHRWQTALVRAAAEGGIGRGALVLDVATGTAGVARQLVRDTGCRVVGVDQSSGMLNTARRMLAAGPAASAERIRLARGSAEHLPFPSGHYDGVTFTYLFRYVPDLTATLREIVRVARPGAFVGFVEFHLPKGAWKPLWDVHTRLVLPAAGRLISPGWHEVGAFLGPSIERFYATWDAPKLCAAMEQAGLEDVRYRLMSLGGGVVMWGAEVARDTAQDAAHDVARDPIAPAFYARGASGWRAWWTLLHPPYTLMHLSFVALGAGLAPELNLRNLIATLLAFALALGIAAHALDELAGRPLGTDIPRPALIVAAVLGLVGAAAIGVLGMAAGYISTVLVWFILAGVFLVLSYSLELCGGLFHSDVWFGLAWGAFPVLTANFAQTGQLNAVALLGAAYALTIAVAQRALSTPARSLRRKVSGVEGQIHFHDGHTVPVDRALLLSPLERVLRLLVVISVLVAAAVLAMHVAGGSWVSGW